MKMFKSELNFLNLEQILQIFEEQVVLKYLSKNSHGKYGLVDDFWEILGAKGNPKRCFG